MSELPVEIEKACAAMGTRLNPPEEYKRLASELLAECERRYASATLHKRVALLEAEEHDREDAAHSGTTYAGGGCIDAPVSFKGCSVGGVPIPDTPPSPPALEPCPWCGGEAVIQGGVSPHARCINESCAAFGPGGDPTGSRWSAVARRARGEREHPERWLTIDKDTFTSIINAECSCGGKDAQDPDSCAACRIYGRFMEYRADIRDRLPAPPAMEGK